MPSIPSDRDLVRIGGYAAMLGAALTLVSNVIHPRTPLAGEPLAVAAMIASSTIWVGVHVGLLFGLLLIAGGFTALYRSLVGHPGDAWARLGYGAVLIGTGVFGALSAIDGLVRKQLADAIVGGAMAADEAAQRLFAVVEGINFGLFAVFVLVLLGFGFVLFGLAVARTDVYPRWLGWVAVVAGLGNGIVAVLSLYRGPVHLLVNVLFPVFSIVATVWIFVIGVLMLRAAQALHHR